MHTVQGSDACDIRRVTVKSEILAALRSADGYVSGQELCEKFGVSRTAVWKPSIS